MPRLAYSYQRFSSPDQKDGDSLARQQTNYEMFCKMHGLTADTKLKIVDAGRSGFAGLHLRGNLGGFLDKVVKGLIPKGKDLGRGRNGSA